MIVIVRLDLDKYEMSTIERLVQNGVISMGEATEARVIRELDDVKRLMWVRKNQRVRELLSVG